MRVSATTPITVIAECRLSSGNKVGNLSPDGILAGKAFARGSLRDERHVGIGAIGGRDIAAGDERTLHRGQIVGVDPAHVDRRLLSSRYGMIRPGKIIHPGFTRQRRHAGEGDRLHAGQLTESREGAVGKGQPGRISLGAMSSYCGANRSTCASVTWLESKPRFCRSR